MKKDNPLYWPRTQTKSTEDAMFKVEASTPRSVEGLTEELGEDVDLGETLAEILGEEFPVEEQTKTEKSMENGQEKNKELTNLIAEVYESWAKTKR